MIIILLEFGGLILLNVESISPDSNIKNASDVLWYIFVSITTVGYGDKFPVTNAGRIIGILILTAGVGLFGTLTAYLSNAFIKPKEEKPDHSGEISKDVYEINRQMTAILNSLKSIEGSNAELKARLEEIEDTLRKRELR
jgi:voltage-gated potassium channel